MYNQHAIALKIRKIRECKQYPQIYLAAKLNMSQNAYSKIELAYTKLTVKKLLEIAHVLEVEPTELLEIEEMMAP